MILELYFVYFACILLNYICMLPYLCFDLYTFILNVLVLTVGLNFPKVFIKHIFLNIFNKIRVQLFYICPLDMNRKYTVLGMRPCQIIIFWIKLIFLKTETLLIHDFKVSFYFDIFFKDLSRQINTYYNFLNKCFIYKVNMKWTCYRILGPVILNILCSFIRKM